MAAGTDFVDFKQLQPETLQQFDRIGGAKPLAQFHIAPEPRIEKLIQAAKRNGVPIGLNLQNQLDEIAELQRLPESLGRLARDQIAVFGDLIQFIAPP